MPVDLESQLRDYWTTVSEAMPDLDAEEIRRHPLRLTAPDLSPVSRWHPVLVAGVAALLVLLLVGGAALLLRSAETEPADEFDYPMSEIPPFRATFEYRVENADTARVDVSYGGDGLFRIDLVEAVPSIFDESGSFTVIEGSVRKEYSAGENWFQWLDVAEGNGVADLLEPFSFEPWDTLCSLGLRENLLPDRVAGRDTTRMRCSYGNDSYELSIDSETGLVLQAAGGAVPEPGLPEGCLCAVGFEVVTVEYDPDLAEGHFDVEPPPGTEVLDLRGTTEAAEEVPLSGPEVGEPAPWLQGTTLDGQGFDLADLRGNRVALYFWASWCNPDHINPGLAELQDIATSKPDIVIVTLVLDSDLEQTRQIMAELGVEFPTVEYNALRYPWQIYGVPHLVLVDRDGTVVHSEPGYQSIGPLYPGIIRDLGW